MRKVFTKAIFLSFQVWKEALRKITNNVRMNNVCPTTNLQKQLRLYRFFKEFEIKNVITL